MPVYTHPPKRSLHFHWDLLPIAAKLAKIRFLQGRLIGKIDGMAARWQKEAHQYTMNQFGTDEAEGKILSEVFQHHEATLTPARLFNWHAMLFPDGTTDTKKKSVYYHAPVAKFPGEEVAQFLRWFNETEDLDPVLKAAIAHIWFLMIRPFPDGNVRIALAILEMQLARADQSSLRFYCLSARLAIESGHYRTIVEQTRKESPDLTGWLDWFLGCMDNALTGANETLAPVLRKARFWERHMSTPLNERQRMMLEKLLDGRLEDKLTSSLWARQTRTSQDSAGRDINDLVEHGILKKTAAGGRSTNYSLVLDVKS